MTSFFLKTLGVLGAAGITFAMAGAYKSTSSVQTGNPGLGMEASDFNDRLAARVKANSVPPALPAASQSGQLSIDAYKNVQVLGHITSGEMTRLMTAMTIWVAPKQGCAYCHAPQRDPSGNIVRDAEGNPQADQNNLHSDELYTKRVARRMLQMTLNINSGWQTHVKETGVTCYTCHRGNPVPANIWYDQPESEQSSRLLGNPAGQNAPSLVAGLAALPSDPFRPFLAGDEGIRVISTEALPIDNRLSIKQTEWTYALMMHISNALGVNCTHCHNTRSMGAWEASPPARAQAWYGIRMTRELNREYLEPLLATFPPERIGPTGDAPKLNCATCHQGAYRPLLGVSMLKDYTVLAEAKPQPQKSAPPPPPADPAAQVEQNTQADATAKSAPPPPPAEAPPASAKTPDAKAAPAAPANPPVPGTGAAAPGPKAPGTGPGSPPAASTPPATAPAPR